MKNNKSYKEVRLVGFFEPTLAEIKSGKWNRFISIFNLSPDEIVAKMNRNDDSDYPFYFGGEDAGDTPCEWASEEYYSIDFLTDQSKRFTSDSKYLVCYEEFEDRVEIYEYR